MFKPPKLEDEDFSPFGGKSGLFSGGRGLFDDDDDVTYIFFILCILRFQKLVAIIYVYALWCLFQGDLFSEAPKPPVSEERKVRKESLKSTGRTDCLKKNVLRIL